MMTAEQLIAQIKSLQFEADDNPAAIRPLKFFNYNVLVISPDGTPAQRNPKYCATAYGASAIAAVLGAASPLGLPIVLMGNAVNFSGLLQSWNDTELVPYLQFANGDQKGKPINAGLLLDYFVHGYPADLALNAALAEVQGSF